MLYSETNLVRSFGKSIINKYIDPALDVEEKSVDALLEDVLLVEKIPVLKDICAPGKTVAVSDKFFCKRLVAFIQEFNNGNISQYKMDKHIDKLKEDQKLDSEYEQVLLLIEQCSQASQAKYLARFYQSYWNGDYDWDSFREIADANQRMFDCDYAVLQSVAGASAASDKESSISRLASLGLIVDQRAKGDGLSLSEFGIEFAKGLDAKKKTTRRSATGSKKPSINEDLFSGRLFSSDKTEEPKPATVDTTDPEVFKNMDIDDAFALLAAAPSPFKPLDSEPVESTRAKIAPEAPKPAFEPAASKPAFESAASKAKTEPEVSNAKLVTEAPKTRPGTSRSKTESSASKTKSTPKPAFDPKDTSQMGVKQLRPIINTENDSPYASSPMASDGSSPFKPAKPKKIEADTPKTKTTRSKSASATADIPDDNNPFRAAANSESKTPKSAENSPFKPIGAPAASETASPFMPAASKPEPAAKAVEPSPFKPAAIKAEPAAKPVEPSPFKPLTAAKPEPAAKAVEPSPFKPAPAKKSEPAAPKAAEPNPFKPLGATKTEAPAAEPSPFKPLGGTEAPKAAEPASPFKPFGAMASAPEAPAAETASAAPFKPFGNINQDPPVHIEAANPNMFNMGSVSHPDSDSSKGTSKGTSKLGSFMSMDDDEVLHQDKETGKLGSYMSMDEGEDTGERLPQRSESSTNYFAMSSASSASSQLSSSAANPFKPMKPANSASSSRGGNPSPFKPATPDKPEDGAPANPSPFKPLGS